MNRLLFALFVLAIGCTPSVMPPGPDLSDAAPPSPGGACAQACAALLAIHCPEGSATDCVSTLQLQSDARSYATPNGKPLTCASVALVTTPTQARAAGIACASP